MQQLTGLDASFRAFETANSNGHVGGPSGAELLSVLLDLDAGGRELPAAQPFRPERRPGPAAMTVLAGARLAWRPVQTVHVANQIMRVLPPLGPAVGALVGGMLGLGRGDGAVIPTVPGRAPATPINKPITPHRRAPAPRAGRWPLTRVRTATACAAPRLVRRRR